MIKHHETLQKIFPYALVVFLVCIRSLFVGGYKSIFFFCIPVIGFPILLCIFFGRQQILNSPTEAVPSRGTPIYYLATFFMALAEQLLIILIINGYTAFPFIYRVAYLFSTFILVGLVAKLLHIMYQCYRGQSIVFPTFMLLNGLIFSTISFQIFMKSFDSTTQIFFCMLPYLLALICAIVSQKRNPDQD